MRFPDDWPQGCPPDDSEHAKGVMFRIVGHDPVHDRDFLSQFDLGRAATADPCLRRALSIFSKVTDAEHRRRLTPKLGRYIAQGTLEHAHGDMKHTGGDRSSHVSWWPCEGIDRKAGFLVMQGI